MFYAKFSAFQEEVEQALVSSGFAKKNDPRFPFESPLLTADVNGECEDKYDDPEPYALADAIGKLHDAIGQATKIVSNAKDVEIEMTDFVHLQVLGHFPRKRPQS